MNHRQLSTIELTVLGMAWLRGPCTIYTIMKELSTSESTYHKSRAGTAYSVANRLLKFKLLLKSGTDDVQISEEGIAALQEWMTPPLPLVDVAHSADLIRLRFFFLGVLDQGERLAFIDNAIAGLRTFLEKCEGLMPKNEEIGDYFGVLATLSVVMETRTRIEWLTIVRNWVEDPMAEGQPWAQTVMDQCPSFDST